MLPLAGGMFLGWTLGANNAANVFGTAVSAKIITFRKAAILCGIAVILGAPKYKRELEDTVMFIFGEDVTFRYYPYKFEWIAVECRNDKVIRVLRRDFFNEHLIKDKL